MPILFIVEGESVKNVCSDKKAVKKTIPDTVQSIMDEINLTVNNLTACKQGAFGPISKEKIGECEAVIHHNKLLIEHLEKTYLPKVDNKKYQEMLRYINMRIGSIVNIINGYTIYGIAVGPVVKELEVSLLFMESFKEKFSSSADRSEDSFPVITRDGYEKLVEYLLVEEERSKKIIASFMESEHIVDEEVPKCHIEKLQVIKDMIGLMKSVE